MCPNMTFMPYKRCKKLNQFVMHVRHNNNNNLFIYSALFNMLGDQKRITTINNLKTINTNIKIIQTYLISKRC